MPTLRVVDETPADRHVCSAAIGCYISAALAHLCDREGQVCGEIIKACIQVEAPINGPCMELVREARRKNHRQGSPHTALDSLFCS